MCIFYLTTPHINTSRWIKHIRQKSCVLSYSILARRDEHKSLTYQADIWLPLSGCSETDYSRDVLCWENKLLPTAHCLLYSLPSSVVSLFLPWGGDGRFLQGKSNNLSRHQTSLHLENIEPQCSRAPFRLFFWSLPGK